MYLLVPSVKKKLSELRRLENIKTSNDSPVLLVPPTQSFHFYCAGKRKFGLSVE